MLNLKNQNIDKGTGYFYVYDPIHPMSNKAGNVYVHRYVAEAGFGIKLTPDLIVHHKDENKLNNELTNLEVMTYSEHARHHHGADFVECVQVLWKCNFEEALGSCIILFTQVFNNIQKEI
ncbi:HNH endonuclease [Salmonella phage SSBI34]|nr:HNH endonuclease [Salmonella phage SSBI34]